ncbi:helix-turn-helix transcriptional regulator [Burkholderia gladioli]|uniref:helix-turn-helix transcriptional regulator n=1 Tax=Burkholderia gladioli TaxID=28095 RepID=UPI001FC8A7BC|nr:AlpA family phage regulatory protein [Burkholderia gladioli]
MQEYFVRLPQTSLRPYFDSTARFIAAAFLLLAEQAISEQKMALKILRLIGVLDCVGVKKTTLYRWIRDGKFPAPVQLGARSVGWRATDVQQWLESRQSTRGQA